MKPMDAIMVSVALLIGMLMAYSTGLWSTAFDKAPARMRVAKQELIQSAGLLELHNKVYSKVGEQAWEAKVKPQFMRAITLATVRESGELFPDWPDIVKWVRAHPEAARRLLEESARDLDRP